MSAVAGRQKRQAFFTSFAVILCRPEHPENIGLVARAMKNTGFRELRLAPGGPLDPAAFKTAVHAGDILDRAALHPDLASAVSDLHLVFAATAKSRKNFGVLSFDAALEQMIRSPRATRIGLLFGNERTGLTSEELAHSNFRFTIPQAAVQPSYNLAAAVLITLFLLFSRGGTPPPRSRPAALPLRRRDQEVFLRAVLRKMEERGFLHATNKKHMEERIADLFGRLALTEDDRRLLLALFSKGMKAL